MTKSDLKKRLRNNCVPEDSYSLEGGLPNEAYCLNSTDIDWEVYYSERGNKTGLKKFSTESEACEHLYSLLVK